MLEAGEWWEVGEEKGAEEENPALLLTPRETRMLKTHGSTLLGLWFAERYKLERAAGFGGLKLNAAAYGPWGETAVPPQGSLPNLSFRPQDSAAATKLCCELPAPQGACTGAPTP